MTHVICVGDLMIDVVAKLPRPLAIGSDTPAAIAIHGGGAAANVAAWLVSAGASATFFGRIGDDPFGLQAVEELTAAGVEPLVTIDPSLPTGTCIVLVDEHGERTMVPCAGANDAPSDPTLLPAEADWLYLSGYSLLSPGSRAFGRAVLDVARQRGWSIAVDAASSAPLQAVGGSTFLDWVGADLLLFANIDEALVLTGLVDPGEAARALGKRCGRAIVKRGIDGAVWSDGTELHAVPASRTQVVDSTGAGDAFAAGFLAGGGDAAESLTRAVDRAARAVSRVGARPGPR